MAWVDLLRGRTEAAVTAIEAYLAAFPTTGNNLIAAMVYLDGGLIANAVRHLKLAIARDANCRAYIKAAPAFRPFLDLPEVKKVVS